MSLSLPSFAGFTWGPADVTEVLPAALGLAFVASVNILITSRVVEHFQGRHRPLRAADADAELGAYGIANLCAGVFGAPLSVGIPARSLANLRCGGTTRLSNLLHAVFLLMLAGFGAGLIARIPLAALAGVTAYVGLGLLEWSTWRRLPRMRRLDAAAFLATAAAVLSTNAVAAVAIGCSFYVVRHSLVKMIPFRDCPPSGLARWIRDELETHARIERHLLQNPGRLPQVAREASSHGARSSGSGSTRKIRASRASPGPSRWMKPSASAGSTAFARTWMKPATRFASPGASPAASGAPSTSSAPRS